MSLYIFPSDEITPSWLAAVLRQEGLLASGDVLQIASEATVAFNSHTQRRTIRAVPREATNRVG